MKIILAIVALLTALVAVRGKTWNENARGLAKLTIVGKIAVLLAVASVGLTVAIEFRDRGENQSAKVMLETKRLDAKLLLAREAYEIELMVSALEAEQPDKETLARLRLRVSMFEMAFSLEGSLLGRKDRVKTTEFMQFAKTELAEMEFGESMLNILPAEDLARLARELRIELCWELMQGSCFCRLAQGNPTANAFVATEDERMILAMQEARSTLSKVIENLQQLTDRNIEIQIKAAIPTGESREHIWLTDTTYRTNKFHGIIGNFPQQARFLDIGDPYSVLIENVSDWMFVYEGQLYGGYTLRITRSRMTESEKAAFDKKMRFTITDSPLVPSWQ
jgi:uncharacterized protein YegJ (DUF2314 family)